MSLNWHPISNTRLWAIRFPILNVIWCHVKSNHIHTWSYYVIHGWPFCLREILQVLSELKQLHLKTTTNSKQVNKVENKQKKSKKLFFKPGSQTNLSRHNFLKMEKREREVVHSTQTNRQKIRHRKKGQEFFGIK